MPFNPPTFNLTVNIWHAPHNFVPPTSPPDLITMGNLRFLWTANAIIRGPAPAARTFSSLSVPAHTDIRPAVGLVALPGNPDVVECPAGSGRFYVVEVIEDVAKGFPNEYRSALMRQVQSPTPAP